jgi:hypothetical protein
MKFSVLKQVMRTDILVQMESLGLLSKSDFRKIEGFECECTPWLSLCVGIMGRFFFFNFLFFSYLFIYL